MGEEANDILCSTNISSAYRAKYNSVMGKFDEYFKVRKNVIFEWARFNRRNQLPDESVEEKLRKKNSRVHDSAISLDSFIP